MKNMLIALGIVSGIATMYGVAYARADEQPAPATRAAIAALYVGGDEAQAAVTHDYCELDPDTRIATQTLLTGEPGRQYGHIVVALQAAFDATNGSDGELVVVVNDFCAAASER